MFYLVVGDAHVKHRTGDLPAYMLTNGYVEYWMKGIVFRKNDLPNVVYSNGDRFWYNANEHLHRANNLPAIIIKKTGKKEYWENGIKRPAPEFTKNQ